MRTTGTWIVAMGLALVGAPEGVQGQTTTLDTLSLWQLPGVRVVVEPVSVEARADGLNTDSLLQVVETKIIDAGIQLLSEDEWQVTIGNPLLVVSISLLRPSEFFYLYHVEVDLQQLVVLARDSTIPSFSPTWSAGGTLGSVPAERVGSLRAEVLRQVDRFISAHAVALRSRSRWIRPRPSA